MEVVIPGYDIIKEIGKGGMATVYIATQQSFNRQVALKIMAPHLTGDPVFGERFLREARIIASLNHRNIVPVYDVGQTGSHHYLSMEYLPGGDLKSRLKQGIRIDEALLVIYEIACALAYAHSKSYIHRDIKPENILFREDNTVALTDFGIAKALDVADCNMTSTGMIVGSPHYMSPEQALARKIDTRTDIYSLGVVFYEVLAGRPLYDADSSVAAAIKHISEPIPALPERFVFLQSVLEKMVAKAPEDRFQTALEPYLRMAPDQWHTMSLQDFKSETEGGTKIMLRSPLSGSAPIVTPIPVTVDRADSAKSPTLHDKANGFATLIANLEQSVDHSQDKLINWISGAGRNKALAAVSVVLLVMVAAIAMQSRAPAPVVAQIDEPVDSKPAASVMTLSAAAEVITPQLSVPIQIPEPTPQINVETETVLTAAPMLAEHHELDPVSEALSPQSQHAMAQQALDMDTVVEVDAEVETQEPPQISSSFIEAAATQVAIAQPAPVIPTPLTALMAEAETALQRERLMFPKGKSAFDKYTEVLTIDPDHEGAKRGLGEVVTRYLNLSSRELNAGDLSKAQEFVGRADTIVQQHGLADSVSVQVSKMRDTINRVHYLEVMGQIEKWAAVLQQTDTVTVEALNQAYSAYMAVLGTEYSEAKVNHANNVYSDAFFTLGKQYFKNDDMAISKELIVKGLQINPEHEKLMDLQARWQRKSEGKSFFLDRFY